MAGILHANSIISDSLISPSSPIPTLHEESGNYDAPPQVVDPHMKMKRAGRTYGRPKAETDVREDTHDGVGSRACILKTAPRHAQNQVIPESDDAVEGSPKFTGFAWRAQLKAIDDGPDIPGGRDPPLQVTSERRESIEQSDISITRQVVREACAVSSISEGTEGLFDGFLRPAFLSSSPTPDRPPFHVGQVSSKNEASATPSKQRHPVTREQAVNSLTASDSDDTSPKHPFPIDSPKRRSSTTPPTSPLGELALQDATDDDEKLEGDATGLRKRGKGLINTRKSDTGKGKAKERSTKAPTKREREETCKESARIQADRRVFVPRGSPQRKHTVVALFHKLRHSVPTVTRRDSDPIVPFSSPGNLLQISRNSSSDGGSPLKSAVSMHGARNSRPGPATHFQPFLHPPNEQELGDVDHEPYGDMPDLNAILRDHDEKRLNETQEQKERAESERRAKELKERKRRALEAAQLRDKEAGRKSEDSDADDDFEVEEMVNEEQGVQYTASGKTQTPLTAGPGVGGARAVPKYNSVSQKSLELAARPSFVAEKNSDRMRGRRVSQKDLNGLLLLRVDTQSSTIEEQKKEQWMTARGTIREQCRPETEGKPMTEWLHKGSTRENLVEAEDRDGDDDEDDPEYREDIENIKRNGCEGSDIEAETRESDDELTVEQHMDVSDEDVDADKENHRPAPRKHHAIIDSDDECGEAYRAANSQSSLNLVPDTNSVGHSEDSPGGDKENSAELAFSFSDNKENEGVPRHHERGRFISLDQQHGSSLLGLSSPASAGGSLQICRQPLSNLDLEGELTLVSPALAQRRESSLDRVLQVLHEEDKDATFAPLGPRKEISHRRSSTPSSDSENLEGSTLVSPVGLSQLFAAGNDTDELAPSSILGEGEFSQFFTQGSRDGGSICETPVGRKTAVLPSHLGHGGELDFQFTQPNALLPSVRITESQRREVDEMFGKDQEFKLDEARKSKNQLQRAESSLTGNVYLGSFTPSQSTQLAPQSIRRPLETLTLDSGSADTTRKVQPRPAQRRRLLRERPRKRSSSPASPSPPSVARNAFDVLRDAAVKGRRRERSTKQTHVISEYVEAEAQESDEEAMLGFGGADGDDDNEGRDEDPDAIVEGLVDDAVIDEMTQAADLVLEKHMEYQAAEDAAIEKLHQDAVEGKLRGKRRGRGAGLDDSDSEEEEYRVSRKPSNKKRRVEGDTLDTYGENPETRPFYNTYQADLAEVDDPALAYLKVGEPIPTQGNETEQSSVEEDVEAVDSFEMRRRIILQELNDGLRPPSPQLDTENAAWVDSEDQDMADLDNIRVEDGPLHRRKNASTTRPMLDHLDYKDIFQEKRTDTNEQSQLKAWASQESRAHAFASGRGGFSARKDSDSGNSSRKMGKLAPHRSSTTSDEGRVSTKGSSLISHVTKRKGFDS